MERWAKGILWIWPVLLLGAYGAAHRDLFSLFLTLWPFALLLLLWSLGSAIVALRLSRSSAQAARFLVLFHALTAIALMAGFGASQWAQRLPALLGVLGLWIMAWALGGVIVRAFNAGERTSRDVAVCLISELGLGLGALALVTLFLGVCGGLNPMTAGGVGLLLLFFSRKHLFALSGRLKGWLTITTESFQRRDCLWLSVILTGLLLSLPAASLPPLDYDVTEYHVQLPRDYVETGRVAYRPHNPFSAMPQNMEMLTTWIFTFAGRSGVLTAKWVHWGMLVLLAGALILWASRRGGRVAGWLAGLFLLSMPISHYRAATLYVEVGMCAWGVLALLQLDRRDRQRVFSRCALAGIFLGFACGAKYPALLFFGVPGLGYLATVSAERWSDRWRCLLFGLGGLTLSFSPWLLKNLFEQGNPIAPLANSFFHVDGWTPTLAERFAFAHRSRDFSFLALREALARISWQSIQLLPFVLLGLPGLIFVDRENRCRNMLILAWLIFSFGVWFFFTHRLERFAYPFFVLAATGSAWGLRRWFTARYSNWAWGGVIGLWTWAQLLVLLGLYFGPGVDHRLSVSLGCEAPETFLGQDSSWRTGRQLAALPKGSRVLWLGEAAFFYQPSFVEGAVVFAHHPLMELLRRRLSPEALHRELTGRGITHLAIRWSEVARLHATYHRAYDCSPEAQRGLVDFLKTFADPSQPLDARFSAQGAEPMRWPDWPGWGPDRVMAEGFWKVSGLSPQSARVQLFPGSPWVLQRPWLGALVRPGGESESTASRYLMQLWRDWPVIFSPQDGSASPLARFPVELFSLHKPSVRTGF